jgi:ribosome production factor 1
MAPSIKPRNKIRRQRAWVEKKKRDGRAKHVARVAGRSEEGRIKKKPITLDDKRTWPTDPSAAAKDVDEEDEDMDDDDDKWLLDDSEDDDNEEEEEEDTKSRRKQSQAKPTPSEPSTTSQASPFSGLLPDPPLEPRILLTTSRHSTLHRQAETLAELLPNSTYIPRSAHRFSHDYSVKEIAKFASNRGFTSMAVLLEDLKRPYGLDVMILPSGPTVHFSIKTWIDGKVLPGHGRATNHHPELLLNNFVTPLGEFVGGIFQRLFPARPELAGRQVVTVHNQRDYIFLRRHRYVFRDKRPTEHSSQGTDGKPLKGVEDLKVGLQEIGPRLTLKLRKIDQGIQTGHEPVWKWTPRMEKVRTMFQL